MGEQGSIAAELEGVFRERLDLENRLQKETGQMSDQTLARYHRSYSSLQRRLAQMFRGAGDEKQRISMMLEIIRIMENRLVYLQNFVLEASPDNRQLAAHVAEFLRELKGSVPELGNLERTYYSGIAALYAGDIAGAREAFRATCESEESDETTDVKYKSFVILGHVSHQERDYQQARELHDRSVQFSHNSNVTAQALALKALNSYALGEHDEAFRVFQEALELFRPDEPFFNSYFYRNALLFCGMIALQKKDYATAERFYRDMLGHVQPGSYDHFDALSQLGRACYLQGKDDDAADTLSRAVETHRTSENEYFVDTCFWLARAHLRRNETAEAKRLLERVAASDVNYERKAQALDLLKRVS